MSGWIDVHRRPGEESIGLYPGLVVSDGEHSRVTGSITIGPTRLPMWAVISGVICEGWSHAEREYYPDEHIPAYHDFDASAAANFFYNLMELRGEFGRLLLVLADAERTSTIHRDWTGTKKHRKRVADQLRRCLVLLEADAS